MQFVLVEGMFVLLMSVVEIYLLVHLRMLEFWILSFVVERFDWLDEHPV